MRGERMARRALAGEGHHVRRLGCSTLGGDLVLGRRTLEFLERQFHLIEQARRAFGVLAIELARQLLDLQSLVRDQSGIVGSPGPGDRKFRLHPRRSGALGEQRRPQRLNIFRQVFSGGGHAGIES